jgi:hypothetical protein
MSLSKEQFGQMELPFPKGDWDKGRKFDMPNDGYSGYSQGHPQARLYRVVDTHEGSKASPETGGVGIHWTHDIDAVKWLSDQMHRPVVYEAAHPGHEHVMTYDDPKDAKTLKDTTGFDKDNAHDMVPAEVPIRPGAPIRVMAVHHPVGTNGWRRTRREYQGRA